MNEPIITIIGNLTADPEVRFTQSGTAVASITIASTPRVKDGNDWKDGETLFLRATAWREQAENIGEMAHKGTKVIAQGRLTQRSFETKEGEKRTSIELQIDDIGIVIPRTKPNAQRAGQPVQGRQEANQAAAQSYQHEFPEPAGYDPNAPF